MKRATALDILKLHEAELKELGVVSVSLFGSTARDAATDQSDVDLAIRLTPGPRGFPHLDRLDRLRARLSVLLGRPVDVVEEPTSRPRIQQEIERDRQLAF